MAFYGLFSVLMFSFYAVNVLQGEITDVTIESPALTVALADHPLELTCTVEGWKAGMGLPEWSHKYSFSEDKSGRYLVTNEIHDTFLKSTLRIVSVNMADDMGAFYCTAGHVDNFVEVNPISVDYNNVNLTIGFETLIKIDIKPNYEDMTTSWLKDGVPFTDLDDLMERSTIGGDNQSISISDTRASDGGIYTARIDFNTGTPNHQSFDINVTALGVPYIQNAETPDKLQNVDNTSIALMCPARGQPAPKVIWFRGKEVLESADRLTFSAVDGVDNAKLEITNTTPSDMGEYTCTAENYMGKASVMFEVRDPYASKAAAHHITWTLVVTTMLLAITDVCARQWAS